MYSSLSEKIFEKKIFGIWGPDQRINFGFEMEIIRCFTCIQLKGKNHPTILLSNIHKLLSDSSNLLMTDA